MGSTFVYCCWWNGRPQIHNKQTYMLQNRFPKHVVYMVSENLLVCAYWVKRKQTQTIDTRHELGYAHFPRPPDSAVTEAVRREDGSVCDIHFPCSLSLSAQYVLCACWPKCRSTHTSLSLSLLFFLLFLLVVVVLVFLLLPVFISSGVMVGRRQERPSRPSLSPNHHIQSGASCAGVPFLLPASSTLTYAHPFLPLSTLILPH